MDSRHLIFSFRAFLWSALCLVAFLLNSETRLHVAANSNEEKERKAWGAMEWWYTQRSYPNDLMPIGAFSRASVQAQKIRRTTDERNLSSPGPPPWRSLGPTNVSGRILALAVDPLAPNIIWAGSAGGGLWKSTTRGSGTTGWSYINTGFPTMAVSAIAIDPVAPSTMYIGTGEISLYKRPLIGISGARASYGMGILRSTDSGDSWNLTSLTFAFPEITAVQKIIINPKNTATLYAATSEGTFRSTDRGTSWAMIHDVLMAMDVVVNPVDTAIIYVACGNLNSTINPGLYRTNDAGQSWIQLTNGLPASDFGRTSLSISEVNPLVLYAGVSHAGTSGMHGLFATTDGGESWTLKTSTNYVGSQGWYNNVVAIHPDGTDTIFCSGIDFHKSMNGGTVLVPKSNWSIGYRGVIVPGGSEGPPGYMHADHHALAFDPTDSRIMYFGTDGGVFVSTDGGETFAGRNGGLVTTQFYPGFAVSAQDSIIALGGLQDNGVLKFSGIASWGKVDGGDGGWCAIDAANPSVMFDEYIYLSISKSTNGGASFFPATSGLSTGGSSANFIAPFVMSPSNPAVLYAGAKNVFKTTNSGGNWFAPNGGANLNGTTLSAIGISWTSPDTLMAATGTGSLGASPLFQLFSSTNGGSTWTNVTGSLPARYITDVTFSPGNSAVVYVTLSGFGTPHVFRSTTLGGSWTDISGNLPDIPHQAVVVDPEDPERIYVGTDLGVFLSADGGLTWEDFSDGMPPAMIMDLVVSRPNASLRAVTFGSGAWERYLKRSPQIRLLTLNGGESLVAGTEMRIFWTHKYLESITIDYSGDNGTTWNFVAEAIPAQTGFFDWTVPVQETRVARLRIRSHPGGEFEDISDTTFGIFIDPDILPGWNLLSVPFQREDMSARTVFPRAVSPAYTFDVVYRQREILEKGSGYWMKFENPEHLTFPSETAVSDTVRLHRGWNLIGSPGRPFPVDSIRVNPEGLLIGNIFGYNGGYIVADTLHPGKGYWVKAGTDGTIFLGDAPAGPALFQRSRFPKRL